MVPGNERFRVEVVYALAERQVLLSVDVEAGTTVRLAIEQSGIAGHFPGLDLEKSPVGIFGRRVKPETLVRDGDRIEIYRPLIADPKALRRQRARSKS